MKWRMVAASSLVLVVGLVAWSSFRQSEAQGQVGQGKQGWEYKVVTFTVEEGSRYVEGQTKEINSFAADGWEYVGLLCTGPTRHMNGGHGETITSNGHVLFKRPKK
jgi:hypothetical protein